MLAGNALADVDVFSSVSGSAMTVSTVDAEHRPIVFEQARPSDLQGAPNEGGSLGVEGKWKLRDLGSVPGVGAPMGDMVTWTDVKDGLTYAAVATVDGLMLLVRSPAGRWTARNLTEEIPGAERIVGDVVAFGTEGNRVLLVGFGADGDLLLYRQPNTGVPGHWDWAFANLSERDLKPQGVETPHFVGALSAFSTRWNALNIAGLDAEGSIKAVWIAPGMKHWQVSDLSASAGTPKLTGQVAAFTTDWGAMNIAGVDAEGSLVVTWWVPGLEHWVVSDFSALFGGARLDADSLTAYTTAWGSLNIVGQDERGASIVYWWTPAFAEEGATDRWRVTELSGEVHDPASVRSAMRPLVTPEGQINLFGTNGASEVVRYFWEPGQKWRLENLTQIAEPG